MRSAGPPPWGETLPTEGTRLCPIHARDQASPSVTSPRRRPSRLLAAHPRAPPPRSATALYLPFRVTDIQYIPLSPSSFEEVSALIPMVPFLVIWIVTLTSTAASLAWIWKIWVGFWSFHSAAPAFSFPEGSSTRARRSLARAPPTQPAPTGPCPLPRRSRSPVTPRPTSRATPHAPSSPPPRLRAGGKEG